MRLNLVIAGMAVLSGTSAGACPLKDIASPVIQLAARTTGQTEALQIDAFRKQIIEPNAAAYGEEVIGHSNPTGVDRAILGTLKAARTDHDWANAVATMRKELPLAEARFRKNFPDFRCNFTIYLMDSLGRFDGAGRQVGGQPALVFGIDQIVQERGAMPLPIFLTHEMFHRYHSQVSGFSDDPGEHQAIWRALWAEGLATYVSYKLTPRATPQTALGIPTDLIPRANPHLAAIAGDLLAHFEQVDHDAYFTYFTINSPPATPQGYPWRSGYYVGFLVAQDLNRTHSLHALASMRGAALQKEIRKSLERIIARGPGAA